MAKTDIKSAFRIIPVHPLEYPLLGIKWANEYYFDRCLAMGLKSSCAIFDKFSSSLEWLAMQHLHASAVLHILDDFLFIAPSRVKCSEDLHKFLDMCNFLGVPIAQDKTVGPNTTLQFAGIEHTFGYRDYFQMNNYIFFRVRAFFYSEVHLILFAI